MSMKPTGGPAFPVPSIENVGMTVRQYLAAHAPEVPPGFARKTWVEDQVATSPFGGRTIYQGTVNEPDIEYFTRWAVEYADALLAELAK